LSTLGCFGSCPVFDIVIKNDGSAELDARHHNKITGKHSATISNNSLDSLLKITSHLSLRTLNNFYSVPWTDDETGILKISYNNGKIKTIKDDGFRGTNGLALLYKIIFDIKEKQDWKKME